MHSDVFLYFARIDQPKSFQGLSFKENLITNTNSREYIYYRYWQHDVKRPAHLGIRSKNYKLIYNYGEGLDKSGTSKEKTIPNWEFYDLKNDPYELNDLSSKDEFKLIVKKMDSVLNQWIFQTNDLGEYPESFVIQNSTL